MVVSDGVLSLPSAMLGHNVDPAVRTAWLEDMFLPPDAFDWALNEVVVRSGGRTILIDAGKGAEFPDLPRAGRTVQRLEAAVAGSRDGRGGPVTLGRAHPLLRHLDRVRGPHGELRQYRPRPARRDGHVRRRLAATL